MRFTLDEEREHKFFELEVRKDRALERLRELHAGKYVQRSEVGTAEQVRHV